MSKVRCNGSTTCLYFLILDRVTYNGSKNNSNFLKDGKVTRTASWRGAFMSDFHQLLKDEGDGSVHPVGGAEISF